MKDIKKPEFMLEAMRGRRGFWRRAYMVSSLFGVLENYKP